MSITVAQAPSSLQPAFNDAVYILSSTNSTQDNFKFVVDYYIGGVKVDRQLIPPHPTYGTGYVNIAPILEQRVSKDIYTADNRIHSNENSSVEYVMKFGEAYGTTGTIIYPDLHVTGAKFMWNACFDYEDMCVYSSGDYMVNDVTLTDFLTNRPSSGDIMIDDRAWLYWNDLELHSSTVQISTYNTAGSKIGDWEIDNKFTTEKFLRVVAGPANINTVPDAQFTLGVQPVFTGAEAYYTVRVLDGASGNLTNAYRFDITNNCSRYEKRRFQFLNKLGGYDMFYFTLLSRETSDIERSNYKKGLGSYASSTSFSFSPNDRANSQFHTRVKDKVSVQSDWVTEAQMLWLEELMTSPDVLYDDGTYLIPVNITNATFERKKEVNEKLFALTMEYTLSYDRYRQRL